MKETEGADPCSILPSSKVQTVASGSLASVPVTPASSPTTSVPPAPSSGVVKARKKPPVGLSGKAFSVEGEEGVKEDLSADLMQKRRKRKISEASAEEAALEVDSMWEHGVNHIDCAFPADYNFWSVLDAGLTNGPIREVSVENAFAAKVQMEKELAATKDQVDVLTAERDSALAAPLLNSKIKSLSQELELAEGKSLSALARMKEVEEQANVQAAEFESCRSALEQEKKKVESLTQSLKGKQMALVEAEAAAVHWRGE
ncbi:hypothetical protein PIB30_051449 [Stylosanthes scabra]|uniref:Uncharacterized protein n=1 Tax=Stylosanthes scabra TaxID=79078 RepID=A0ABU6TIE8_9FABA|nr:hypothetical protein [Stylosanthes scabra]